jgi:uncharacterized membrane protein YkvA (DUF1232 family)
VKASIGATVRQFKRRVALYKAMYRHPRTPTIARWLLWAAVAYALSPVDMIPDFIPVIGHLDDAIIVPLFVVLALRMVPDEVIKECQRCAWDNSLRSSLVR